MFSDNFNNATHKPTGKFTLDYDFAFWYSLIAQTLWEECNFISNTINIDTKLECWSDVFHILNDDFKSFDLHKIIKLNLILHTIDCIYNTYKLITDEYTKGEINDIFIDNVLKIAKAQFHEQVTMIIFLTPTFEHYLFVNERNSSGLQRFSERERGMIPNLHTNPNDLTQSQMNTYNETWTNSRFVDLEGKKLVVKPFRREPP